VTSGYTPRKVITAYIAVGCAFTLAASLIWAINTVFLIRVGGLDIFTVMLVNTVYTVAQMVFEIPTGVIADTIGRRASILLSMATLLVATLLYVITPVFGWGFLGFAAASVLIGIGFTFQTGAVDAWLVDALAATGYDKPTERVFAWGQSAGAVGMLVGSLLGGVLGQVNLSLPFVVRTVLLGVAFLVTLLMVRDAGFTPRPLKLSTFGAETRTIFDAGVAFGWHNRVVRPLFLISGLGGLFFMYGFYAWQPFVLELLGRDYVWLLGVVQAGFSAANIAGNFLVAPIMREGDRRRNPAKALAVASVLEFAIAVAIGVTGFAFAGRPGVVPAGIAIAMWLLWGLVFGASGPIRAGYINAHIPSAQRATVLSLDAFFSDAGGAVGQPALGWLSKRSSIAFAWLIGSAGLALAAPLYLTSGRAAKELGEE
jgi:MFS family permease